MATDKQKVANRQNAQKCCGPTSPEGRAKSSQNALKSGIDSKCEIMPRERREEYDELITGFHARFAPATIEEVSLVDALIRFEWLSRRYMAVESIIWTIQNLEAELGEIGRIFLRNSDPISRANQRFAANRRGFAATLKQLKAVQANRPAIVDPPLSETLPATDVATEALNPKLVSFLPFLDPPLVEPSEASENIERRPQEPETGGQDPPLAA